LNEGLVSKQLSIAEARNQFANVIHETERSGPVEVTRRGQPVAVIVSIKEFRRLTARKGGFWAAYQKWKADPKFRDVDIDPSLFEGVRNKSAAEVPNPWL
jgi:prevent-host-death family protein